MFQLTKGDESNLVNHHASQLCSEKQNEYNSNFKLLKGKINVDAIADLRRKKSKDVDDRQKKEI